MNEKTIHCDSYRLLMSWLTEIRKENGLDQAELAKKIGISQRKLSRIENRERRLDIIELWTLCKALDVDFKEIIERLDKVMTGLNK